MQVVNLFLCRSERQTAWRGLAGNRLIVAGVAAELALVGLIAYTPWGNALFDTAAIGLEVWLFMLPFALLPRRPRCRSSAPRRRSP
jgi:hypothetical protein